MFFRFEMPIFLSVIAAAVLIIGAIRSNREEKKVYTAVIQDAKGNTVDVQQVVDKYNSLLGLKNELVEELYVINMCDNCANYDNENRKCVLNLDDESNKFCHEWKFDETDTSKLLHNQLNELLK